MLLVVQQIIAVVLELIMNNQWQQYCEKFLSLSAREQYLILLTGLFVILFTGFTWFIEPNLIATKSMSKEISQLKQSGASNIQTINVLQDALAKDPNLKTQSEILAYKNKLIDVDKALLTLTTDLINPIQMRSVLLELLSLQKGVKLSSLEVTPAKTLKFKSVEKAVNNKDLIITNKNNVDKIAEEEPALVLYQHGMTITLNGSYFQLRDYLVQIEALQWRLFWHKFDYSLQQYPKSELVIEVYSLSTDKEFIGV